MNHQDKLELVRKINNLKSSKQFIKVFKIIKKHNVEYMFNNYGVYLLFHNLQDVVYNDIEKYLNSIDIK